MGKRDTTTAARRNPTVQHVNVAEAVAATAGPAGIVDSLVALTAPIAEAQAHLDALLDQRRALVLEGLDLGMQKVALGRAAGISPERIAAIVDKVRGKVAKAG